jgi:hypothetical protein
MRFFIDRMIQECGEQTNVGVENKPIIEIVKLVNLDTLVWVKGYDQEHGEFFWNSIVLL